MPKISDSLMLRGNITVGATEAVQKSAAKTYLKIISNCNYQVKEQRNITNTAAIAIREKNLAVQNMKHQFYPYTIVSERCWVLDLNRIGKK